MTLDFTLRELEEIFHHALALSPADRGRFLDEACQRPACRTQVERMIEADARARGILDSDEPEHPSALECRTSIGRWNLIERIGSGGLGVVYRASCECDGVTLHAAVKVLPPGLNVVLHECFIQERSILAGLDHPYIARLIDAGAGVCGTSFLAMEFVEGVPLDEYLEQRQPPLSDRLALFNRICDAAAYLHEHGIFHGDLKPSNVMVRADGTPKLLDFGTARLVDGGRDTVESLTRLMMTPAYASPEQMSGLGPSAAGDVYSLGCVLREMLGSPTPAADLAAVRDKCLAPSADQRYESPRDIAADLDRYVSHRPVLARPASSAYVMRRFIGRNPIACGLASLVALSLLLGWFASRQNAMRAQHHADQHQAVVARLVRDESVQRAPDSQQRAAYAAGVADVIAQMEQLQPPPLADLASAWRRLSYTQADRGQTAASIASIEKSIHWGRRYLVSGDAADAGGQLAESLLYASFLQKRRGSTATAGQLALEAVRLVDTLPESRRTAIEHSQQFVRALFPAARRRALDGDIEGGRALLLRAIELARPMGKPTLLRSTLDLVWFERAARQEDRVTAACADATSLGMTTARLAGLCGAELGLTAAQREATVEQESTIFERQLLADPERYRYRVQLARRKLQLARFADEKRDAVRARELVQEARALTEDLLKADAGNRNLHLLLRRIERLSVRVGAGSEGAAAFPVLRGASDSR